MRTFSTAVNGELAKQHGLDPTLFIGVQWDDSGIEQFYSSHDFPGARKQIVSISGIEATQVVTGTGASQSVNVTLSDTDGKVREVLDSIDVHKRPARLYLGFPGVAISDSVILIDGEINSAMEWDDRARTFSFTILNKIEGRLFGFAMEDGLFEEVNEQDRAKAWPFRFGETCAYPAVQIRNGVQGILRLGQGVPDPTLDAKICQARKIVCPMVEDPLYDTVPEGVEDDGFDNATRARQDFASGMDEFGQVDGGSGLDRPFGTSFGSGLEVNQPGVTGGRRAINPTNRRVLVRDKECETNKFNTICQLLRDRANQLEFTNPTLSILGGGKFPQGRSTVIRIDDIIYTGTFSGEVFTIESTQRADAPKVNITCENVEALTKRYDNDTIGAPSTLSECETPDTTIGYRVVGGAGDAWRKLDALADSKFVWLPSGSDVYLEEDSTRVHVVSLVPGTVTGVFAYRRFGDTLQLTELPGTYYEVVETNYGDLTAVEVHLVRGLESYPDENWDNQLYVHFDSDIGPNPADVIEWIINNFTDFTVDAASFASVKASLGNYPCNYYHGVKESALATIQRIAYEARCALIITDGVVKIKYLSKEPDADVILNDSDLVAGSFGFSHTGTEDLVTSSDITWQPRGTDILNVRSVQRRLTVERNVRKYGYFGRSTVYQTITNEEQALKTATFWSIRDSNTWRIVRFQTTLEHMNLELFDTIELNIPQFPNVKTVIQDMQVDAENGLVTFECWTPVLSGTTEQYFFAWPAEAPQELYPSTDFEVEAPLISITPPKGHPLYVENTTGMPPVVATTGDRVPSDLDDTFPETVCQDMNDSELIDVIEPQFKRLEFPDVDFQQQARRADEVAGSGLSFNFEEPEDRTACGRPTFETCIYVVNVQYGTATNIAPSPAPGGGFDCGIKPGPCNKTERGKRCSGPNFFQCRTFGSRNIAEAYKAAIDAQIERAHCSFRVGVTAPVSATLIPKNADSDCPDHEQEIGSDGGGVDS